MEPGQRRGSRLLRGALLFLLGGLVGANATYFAMTRGGMAPQGPAAAVNAAAQPAGNANKLAGVPPTPAQVQGKHALVGRPALRAPSVRATGTGPGQRATPSAGLLLPVQGIAASALVDTFSDARSGGRIHDAIDIMAPEGTPVVAVADGTVEKLFDSKLGGLTLYQFNADRTLAYYYAHLQGYAPGIAERQAIRRGQVIGYVGSTGNANPEAPHLHFAVFQLGPEQRWWEGTAVNPYPLLVDSAR